MSDQGVIVPAEPSAPQPPTPQPSAIKKIFVGQNGIRAGWRALIFLCLCVVLGGLLLFILRFFLHGQGTNGSLTPTGTFIQEGALFLLASGAALIMARIERRKYGQYGLPLKHAFGKDFWIGTLVGFLAISGVLFVIFVQHGFRVTGLAIHGMTILTATISWALAMTVVGLSEEFAFRGYLQFTLTSGMGFWPSAVLLSALFGLAHAGNPGETKVGLLSVVLFGLLFCLFLRRTGNLWWAVGFHAGWDWAQTFFYGVRDSGVPAYRNLFNSDFNGPAWLTGGSVGPEASIFTPIVLVLTAIAFNRIYRENRYQPASRM